MLSTTETSLCSSRPNSIDYSGIDRLHYLGNYIRRLPVSMTRMIENAHDWEHLPFVHNTSFASIELVDSGTWGWRAKTEIPEALGGGSQLFDLLVDADRHYWATTLFAGPSAGVQVHSQATRLGENDIEVDVRFYLEHPPPTPEVGETYLTSFQRAYTRLYDEDETLMLGRQAGIDQARSRAGQPTPTEPILVGSLGDLHPSDPNLVDTPAGIYAVRSWRDAWFAHSIVCPHRLGPLDATAIDSRGAITCPWHGYAFNARTGESLQPGCAALSEAPRVEKRGTDLYLVFG